MDCCKSLQNSDSPAAVSNNIPTDLTLVIDGDYLNVNRLPLAVKSTLIYNLLRDKPREKSTVVLEDLPGANATFNIIVDYCYGKKIDITDENVGSLYCAVNYLGIACAIRDMCEAKVLAILTKAEIRGEADLLFPLLEQCRGVPSGRELQSKCLTSLSQICLKICNGLVYPCRENDIVSNEGSMEKIMLLPTEEFNDILQNLKGKVDSEFLNNLVIRHLQALSRSPEMKWIPQVHDKLIDYLSEGCRNGSSYRPPVSILPNDLLPVVKSAISQNSRNVPKLLRLLCKVYSVAWNSNDLDIDEQMSSLLFLEAIHMEDIREEFVLRLFDLFLAKNESEFGSLAPEDCAIIIQRFPQKRDEFEGIINSLVEDLQPSSSKEQGDELHEEFSQWLDLTQCDERALQILLDKGLCAPEILCQHAIKLVTLLKGQIAERAIQQMPTADGSPVRDLIKRKIVDEREFTNRLVFRANELFEEYYRK